MRSLSKYSQKSPFSDLVTQFQNLANEFDRGFMPSTFRGGIDMDFSPAVDIEEKDGKYLVSADLPGMKKEEIKIDLEDNVLTISGERSNESKGEGKYIERVYGKFLRSFTLPSQVEPDQIEAHFENGVLQITLPKAESARSRAIKIQ